MTNRQLRLFLDDNFGIYKVVERKTYISVTVMGSICSWQLAELERIRASGQIILFETMGWWQTLFMRKSSWKTVL